MEKAVFGAGCFWGVEATFRSVPGVVDTAVGYAGGRTENPTYEQVCTDRTGHAEVIEVTFDPSRLSYDHLLEVFFDCHDPTQLDRQGPDIGTQYRSVIFPQSPEQEAAARRTMERLSGEERFRGRPLVTAIEPASIFWRAEEYHQRYLEKRGRIRCH